MDNTLTGAIPSGIASDTETAAAGLSNTRKRDVKGRLTYLGSATALLIALGAEVEQRAGLSQAITGLFHNFTPETSEWTDDELVIIESDEELSSLTIQICDSELESVETMHIAFLLGKDRSTLPPTFVLKKKGCRGEKGRVWMNPGDFEKYITQPNKADFKLSYSRAHLHSLEH